MSNTFFTQDEINELVIEYADKITTMESLTTVVDPIVKVIHRPLNSPSDTNPRRQPFFLLSINGCFYRFLFDTVGNAGIQVTRRGIDSLYLNEQLLNKTNTIELVDIIKDYLMTCIKRIVEDCVPEEAERAINFLGEGTRECLKRLAGCLGHQKYYSIHRLVFVDMSHG